MVDAVLQYAWSFLQFFWGVFSFWALWQVCDWGLSRLKVKLRKPWSIEGENSKSVLPNGGHKVQ